MCKYLVGGVLVYESTLCVSFSIQYLVFGSFGSPAIMASFANKAIMVTGGSGTIGSSVIRQFLLDGAKVVAPVRSETAASALKSLVGSVPVDTLDICITDIADDASGPSFARQIKEKYGQLDHIVSSIGGWWQKGATECDCVSRSSSVLFLFSQFFKLVSMYPNR